MPKEKGRWLKAFKSIFGDEGAPQAAPMQGAPAPKPELPTAVPSAVGQALAQRPGEVPMREDIPATPILYQFPSREPYAPPEKIGAGRLALAKTLGPTSPMARVGTALATDPTVQAQVGQLAMALGAKSPKGIGYQLGQSIVEQAEGRQYQMLQGYFSDVIAGREPTADLDLENLTLSPELRARAFNDVLAQALGGARVEYFEAGAGRARAEAEAIKTRTPEVIAAEEAAEAEEKERIRLGRQKESREFQILKSTVNDLLMEKSAFEADEEFFKRMGKGGIPEDIPVSWTAEKEQKLNELLARGMAEHDIDLDLLSPTADDAAIESFIQSMLDQGMTEEQVFDQLTEMGIK